MKVLKIMIGTDCDGTLSICDGIEWQGGLWLVPEWLESPSEGYKTPKRLVRVDHLRPSRPGPFGHDLILKDPVSKEALGGIEADGYEILHQTDVRLSIARAVH